MLTLVAATLVATNLPPVVVEASRLDRTPLEIPSAVHVLGPRDLAATGARDAVDLLAKAAPEVHLRRLAGNNPARTEIALRGYGENGFGRVLVLVDGERLNNPDMASPNLARLALGGLSRLEILRGPQVVLLGDGASAGAINVVTEPQTDDPMSFVQLQGGSWGAVGASVGTRGGLTDEGLKYWADGSWSRADGYRQHSGYSLWNLDGGLKKTWEGGTSLRVSGFFNDTQEELPGALTRREWKADPRLSHAVADQYRRSTAGAATTFKARLDDENTLRISGNFSNRRMAAYQQGTGWFSDNAYDIWSGRLLAEWLNAAELFGFANEFAAGVQGAADRLAGCQNMSGSRQRPHYSRPTFDVYAQETFHPADSLALAVGGRYAHAWSYNSLCERSRRDDPLAACDVSLIWNPVADAKVYVRFARFYRQPFLDEVPGRFDSGYTWVNTRLLEPETGWSAEVGADWNLDEELALGASAWASALENEIFYDASRGNNVNADDDTSRSGLDAHVTWSREKTAELSLGVSLVRARFDGGAFDGNRIPLVPAATLTATGRVWLYDDLSLFGGYRYQGDSFTCSDFANDGNRLDWYGVFHVGATFEPSCCRALEGLSLSVCVDNLLDERYCDYATYGTQYYPAAGRTLTVTVRYEF